MDDRKYLDFRTELMELLYRYGDDYGVASPNEWSPEHIVVISVSSEDINIKEFDLDKII